MFNEINQTTQFKQLDNFNIFIFNDTDYNDYYKNAIDFSYINNINQKLKSKQYNNLFIDSVKFQEKNHNWLTENFDTLSKFINSFRVNDLSLTIKEPNVLHIKNAIYLLNITITRGKDSSRINYLALPHILLDYYNQIHYFYQLLVDNPDYDIIIDHKVEHVYIKLFIEYLRDINIKNNIVSLIENKFYIEKLLIIEYPKYEGIFNLMSLQNIINPYCNFNKLINVNNNKHYSKKFFILEERPCERRGIPNDIHQKMVVQCELYCKKNNLKLLIWDNNFTFLNTIVQQFYIASNAEIIITYGGSMLFFCNTIQKGNILIINLSREEPHQKFSSIFLCNTAFYIYSHFYKNKNINVYIKFKHNKNISNPSQCYIKIINNFLLSINMDFRDNIKSNLIQTSNNVIENQNKQVDIISKQDTFKLNIVLVMCFFDETENKENITILQLRYYKYLKELLKKEYEVNIDFILLGSEKEKSQKTVIRSRLPLEYYYEFNQEPYLHQHLVQCKYEYGYRVAIYKYPNLDILLSNGSCDFIPVKFFRELVITELSNKECNPYIYGIKSNNLPNSLIFLILNDLNNCYTIDNIRRSGVPITSKFCGGIYGFNKYLLKNINYDILLTNGHEHLLELMMIENFKAIPKTICDWFINYKIQGCDITPIEFIRTLDIEKYNFDNKEINDFLKLIFIL